MATQSIRDSLHYSDRDTKGVKLMLNQFYLRGQVHWSHSVRNTTNIAGFDVSEMIRAVDEDTLVWTADLQG